MPATIVITGANKGLGYFTAESLAAAGNRIVLAARDPQRLDTAAQTLRNRVPGAEVATVALDLADLASVRKAADHPALAGPIDVLINNAGIVHPPRVRAESVDGLELVMATNLIGHLVLTEELLPRITSRIVWLGSLASRISDSDLRDLFSRDRYTPWRAYATSKVAVQVAAIELARRLQRSGSPVASVVADPGYSIGARTIRVPGINNPNFRPSLTDRFAMIVAQGKHEGAAQLVYAATDLRNGEACGPRWWTRGEPTQRRLSPTSYDPDVGARLWAQANAAAGATMLSGLGPISGEAAN